jgi:hypothetical protein
VAGVGAAVQPEAGRSGFGSGVAGVAADEVDRLGAGRTRFGSGVVGVAADVVGRGAKPKPGSPGPPRYDRRKVNLGEGGADR